MVILGRLMLLTRPLLIGTIRYNYYLTLALDFSRLTHILAFHVYTVHASLRLVGWRMESLNQYSNLNTESSLNIPLSYTSACQNTNSLQYFALTKLKAHYHTNLMYWTIWMKNLDIPGEKWVGRVSLEVSWGAPPTRRYPSATAAMNCCSFK